MSRIVFANRKNTSMAVSINTDSYYKKHYVSVFIVNSKGQSSQFDMDLNQVKELATFFKEVINEKC